ncbi:MAG: hypothetical protein AAB316_01655 [Bacteroidota bacterium]
MDTVQINVTRQMDGLNFYLDPLENRAIIREFPQSHPLPGIFIAVERKENPDFIYDRVAKFILPVLVGIENEKDLKKIRQLKFIEPVSEKVIKTIKFEA